MSFLKKSIVLGKEKYGLPKKEEIRYEDPREWEKGK